MISMLKFLLMFKFFHYCCHIGVNRCFLNLFEMQCLVLLGLFFVNGEGISRNKSGWIYLGDS
jgi:hypothetical protein